MDLPTAFVGFALLLAYISLLLYVRRNGKINSINLNGGYWK